MNYIDRKHAGIMLANLLREYARRTDVIVLALPRGGVPVAYEIAVALSLALDVFIVRKLGAPGQEELAMGAIASGGVVVLNEAIVQALHIDQASIEGVKEAEFKELVRRERLYRGNRSLPNLRGKTIILVDDGMATGSTMKAALLALQQQKPATIVVAVPVAARSIVEEMTSLVDVMICPLQPINFCAVGLWYDHFSQTTDQEVIELLKKSKLPTFEG